MSGLRHRASGCTTALLDTAGADRPWITHVGTTAYVSYHDSQNSSIIRTWKSTDDGLTWRPSGAPLNGQGDITGNSTFNNIQGPIVADPTTRDVFDIFAAVSSRRSAAARTTTMSTSRVQRTVERTTRRSSSSMRRR